MLSKARIDAEAGFTLIELLVVILIVGILAAIALPAFLGQRSKSQDAEAKSDARNMVSLVEAYHTTQQTYVGAKAGQDVAKGGLSVGAAQGQVNLTAAAANTYTIVAFSDSGAKFTVVRPAAGAQQRTCDLKGKGGCPKSGKW